MRDVSSTAVWKFPSTSENSFPANRIELDEEAFNRILVLERKRSERSKRSFMLMLVSLDGISQTEIGGELRAEVFSGLASSKRDIDVLGWYRQDWVAGIIFTEISAMADRAISESLAERIKTNLALRLGPDKVAMIRVSCCFFPEKRGGRDLSAPLALYPDIRERNDSHKKGLLAKRVIDVCGSFFALVLFLPIFLIISAMIKLSTKGPVFFRQERVGQYGKTFTFLKFRSMYVDSDPSIHMEYTRSLIQAGEHGAGSGPQQGDGVFKIRNDPRVTPLGRFLRRSSLDELPQLINVFAGHMSLVGPRPPIPYELENYDLWHWRRVLDMKPGMTGMWQVRGRSRTTFDEMVRLDIYYITHWSLGLDLKLILGTPLAVFGGKGAY